MTLLHPSSTLFPYTTLFRSRRDRRRDPGESPPASARHLEVRYLAHVPRSEEHTSELQSHHDLVCRLLLEKKKKTARSAGAGEEHTDVGPHRDRDAPAAISCR